MDNQIKAVIIISCDDVNDYFLVIDLKTGGEIMRTNTELFGTWRYDDGYDRDDMVAKVAEKASVSEYKTILW